MEQDQFLKPIAKGRCAWEVAVQDRDPALQPAPVRGDRLFAAMTFRDRKGCVGMGRSARQP